MRTLGSAHVENSRDLNRKRKRQGGEEVGEIWGGLELVCPLEGWSHLQVWNSRSKLRQGLNCHSPCLPNYLSSLLWWCPTQPQRWRRWSMLPHRRSGRAMAWGKREPQPFLTYQTPNLHKSIWVKMLKAGTRKTSASKATKRWRINRNTPVWQRNPYWYPTPRMESNIFDFLLNPLSVILVKIVPQLLSHVGNISYIFCRVLKHTSSHCLVFCCCFFFKSFSSYYSIGCVWPDMGDTSGDIRWWSQH